MAEFLSPGSQINEIRKAAIVQAGLATTIGGILVVSKKGPVNDPKKIGGITEYETRFGKRSATQPWAWEAAKGFFNQGGKSLYVSRVVGAGAAAGERVLETTSGTASAGGLTSGASAFPVALAAGDTFLGKVDGGGAATLTANAARASITGAGATYAAVVASGTLVFTITIADGSVITNTVILAGTETTQALWLTAINNQSLGCRAVNSGGQIKIETDGLGSHAAGAIVSGAADVLTSSGLSVGAFTTGSNNVANILLVTAAEFVTLAEAAYTGATITAPTATSVNVVTDTLGAGGSFQFSSGTGVSKVTGFDTAVHTGAAATAESAVTLLAASPGAWSLLYKTQVTHNDVAVTTCAVNAAGSSTTLAVTSSSKIFVGDTISVTKSADVQRGVVASINGNTLTLVAAITIPSGGYTTAQSVVQETWNLAVIDEDSLVEKRFKYLRMSSLAASRYYLNVINLADPSNVTAEAETTTVSDNRPEVDSVGVAFTGGADGSAPADAHFTGTQSARTGVWAFDKARDLNFVSIPGLMEYDGITVAPYKELETYVEDRKDIWGIIDPPDDLTSAQVVVWSSETANFVSSYLSIFYPWLTVADQDTGIEISIPPSGHVQGLTARAHKSVNIAQTPAGFPDGQIFGVLGTNLDTPLYEGSPDYDAIYPDNVNGILNFPGEGAAVVFGSRTLDATGECGQINTRLIFNAVKRELKRRTRFVNFKNNEPSVRDDVVRVATAYFRDLRVNKILKGDTDAEAFFIICDADNNPASVIQQGKLIARYGLATVRAIEFFEETLEQDTRALQAELAAG